VVISPVMVLVPLTDKALILVPPLNVPLPVIVNAFPFPVIFPSDTAVPANVIAAFDPPSVTAPEYVCVPPVVVTSAPIVAPVLVTLILFARIAPDNVT